MDIIEKRETTMELIESLVGKEISCTLDGTFIKKGKMIKEVGSYYLLQNEKNGSDARNKENYKYSWHLDEYNCYELTDIKILNQSIELWI